MKTFYIFALTSISFQDFTFLKDIIGGSLKISLSRGWFCMMCHFLISAFLMLGTDGSYCVTKGKMSFLPLLFSCLNVDSLPMNFISDNEDFFYQDYVAI